jgi:HD-GYP domain-containing protein (c-di-GMP phosphodiesterase class II)
MYTRLEYQEALLNASKGMIRVKDPITLLKVITRFIDRQIGVTHVAVLLYDKKRDSYVLIDSKGEGGCKIPVGYVQVSSDNPIVNFFKRADNGSFARTEALVYEELDHVRNFEILVNRREGHAIHYEDIKHHMDFLRAAVCVPSFYKRELIGILILGEKLSGENYFEPEISLFVTLANDVAMAVKNAELIKDLKSAYEREHLLFVGTSRALASAIDARDKYTHGHSERVSRYSVAIAQEMVDAGMIEYDREFMETVQVSSLLHDIGKIGIRDQILNKAAHLSNEEFEVMKAHVTIGAHIVGPVTGLVRLTDGILYHHERFDGKGYPNGLRGKDIPLIGRIVNAADSFDTLTTSRSYKNSMTADQAFEELRKCSGSQFDPEIVALFYEAFSKKRFTCETMSAPDALETSE